MEIERKRNALEMMSFRVKDMTCFREIQQGPAIYCKMVTAQYSELIDLPRRITAFFNCIPQRRHCDNC